MYLYFVITFTIFLSSLVIQKSSFCLLLPVSSDKHSKQSFYDLLNIVFYNEAICSERQCPLKTSHQFSPMNAFHRILLKQKLWN